MTIVASSLRVSAIQCPVCHDTIYSRATHDYRSCSCGEVAIDGGRDYIRTSYHKNPPTLIELELDVTQADLYKDWNARTDVYGLIKQQKEEK